MESTLTSGEKFKSHFKIQYVGVGVVSTLGQFVIPGLLTITAAISVNSSNICFSWRKHAVQEDTP